MQILICVFQALLKTGEQCWSLAELVQAVVLLAHCHSLCSFVFGSGSDSDITVTPRVPHGTPPGYCLCDAANGNTALSPAPAAPTEKTPQRKVQITFPNAHAVVRIFRIVQMSRYQNFVKV